jgi:hypothetical protein
MIQQPPSSSVDPAVLAVGHGTAKNGSLFNCFEQFGSKHAGFARSSSLDNMHLCE